MSFKPTHRVIAMLTSLERLQLNLPELKPGALVELVHYDGSLSEQSCSLDGTAWFCIPTVFIKPVKEAGGYTHRIMKGTKQIGDRCLVWGVCNTSAFNDITVLLDNGKLHECKTADLVAMESLIKHPDFTAQAEYVTLALPAAKGEIYTVTMSLVDVHVVKNLRTGEEFAIDVGMIKPYPLQIGDPLGDNGEVIQSLVYNQVKKHWFVYFMRNSNIPIRLSRALEIFSTVEH